MGGTCTEVCTDNAICDDGYTGNGGTRACECVDDVLCASAANSEIDLSRPCTAHGDCTGSNEFCVKAGNGMNACGQDSSGGPYFNDSIPSAFVYPDLGRTGN